MNVDKALPAKTDQGPPLLREHRLYQADWLLRYYKFEAKELLTEEGNLISIRCLIRSVTGRSDIWSIFRWK